MIPTMHEIAQAIQPGIAAFIDDRRYEQNMEFVDQYMRDEPAMFSPEGDHFTVIAEEAMRYEQWTWPMTTDQIP